MFFIEFDSKESFVEKQFSQAYSPLIEASWRGLSLLAHQMLAAENSRLSILIQDLDVYERIEIINALEKIQIERFGFLLEKAGVLLHDFVPAKEALVQFVNTLVTDVTNVPDKTVQEEVKPKVHNVTDAATTIKTAEEKLESVRTYLIGKKSNLAVRIQAILDGQLPALNPADALGAIRSECGKPGYGGNTLAKKVLEKIS